jgi:antitoxin component YwqK of YwqJK toxin-antitoxin module
MKVSIAVVLVTLISCSSNQELVQERKEENRFVEEYHKDPRTGLREGPAQSYDPQGRLESESMYRNGLLHGSRKIYDETGALIIEEHYRKGKFHGLYTTYYQDGEVKLQGKYKDGAMMGTWKQYYPNGALMEIVRFENNLENGPFKEYHENGRIKTKGHYLNGDNEHGELLMYDEEGNLVKRMECLEGVCETKWTADEGSD